MNYSRIWLRSLRFYRRTHLGVLAAVAVATAVLVGALVTGDTVRHSMRRMAEQRLGEVEFAVVSPHRLFAADLAGRLDPGCSAVLELAAAAQRPDGAARAAGVRVLGVDERFRRLSASADERMRPEGNEAVVNARLAERLEIAPGDELVLRLETPGVLPLDAPLAGPVDGTHLSVRIRAVVEADNLGDFALTADQQTPLNVFVSRELLAERIGRPGMANLLLMPRGLADDAADADALVRQNWRPADSGLELHRPGEDTVELRSERVFLDAAVVRAAAELGPAAGVLTYFVNTFATDDAEAPYAFAAGVGPLGGRPDDCPLLDALGELDDDEAVVNEWLAERDLQATPGDTLRMSYYVEGVGGRLVERTREFGISAVVPLAGATGDSTLMPEFPGLAGVEDCRNWDPGVPMDLSRIRDLDQRYWDNHGGTPKVFVNLPAAREMWGNRFGELTAIRWPAADGSPDGIAERLGYLIDPAELGLYFQPVRMRAIDAVEQGQDFGQLFLGFSMFLIGSAVLLTGLLFVFGVQQRREEVGTLLAVGWTKDQVRRLLLTEGAVVAVVGGLIGAPAGLGYTAAVAWAMETFWPRAVAGGRLALHAGWVSLVLGTVSAVTIAVLAMWLTLLRQMRRDVRELLAEAAEPPPPPRLRRLGYLPAPLCAAAAGVLLAAGPGLGPQAAAWFFAAGALLLAAFVTGLYAALGRLSGRSRRSLGWWSLAARNVARRRGRSVAVAALLGCASFMVVAVGANRLGVGEDVSERSGPAGGFELMARSSLPIAEDLHTADGRREFGLDAETAESAEAVAFRVHDGDEASCLNIGRAQRPRLLGVRPEVLDGRGAFRFVELAEQADVESPWGVLDMELAEGEIPVIGDQPTLRWSLNKGLGDTVEYTDEHGGPFRLRIVGVIASSVLQGNLVISEEHFRQRFGSVGGYRMALFDAPAGDTDRLAEMLTRAGEPVGLEVTTTAEHLAEFRRVENTYLSIFQILGGLGLLLGTVAVGVVTARNVLERRTELALLRAVGHPPAGVRRLVIAEHWMLLTAGVGVGAAAGLLAVMPAMAQRDGQFPAVSLALTLLAILAGGLVWTYLAASASMRGDLLPALRNE